MNTSTLKIVRLFRTISLFFIAIAGFLLGPAAQAQTQCIITNAVKFQQPPKIDGGWDVRDSTNVVLADDFFCNTTGPVSDIHIWGSWNSDHVGTIVYFWLGIYNDVPAIPGQSPSHPGTNLLWQQFFGPGQFTANPYGTGSELFFDPASTNFLGNDTMAWYYCFYPTNPFVQQGTATSPTNYWLSVYAAVDATILPPSTYGWKTSVQKYNDAAVWGHWTGLPKGDWTPMFDFNQQQLDLAFIVTTATNMQPPQCVETNGTKYVQLPNLNGGFDVWDNGPWVLADDFLCTTNGPITDIHLWGSYLDDRMDTNLTFWLAIYDDVPVSATNNFSHPGALRWHEEFAPGQYVQTFAGTGVERFLDPGPPQILGPDSQVWYYCFYPTKPFVQEGGPTAAKTYWLMVYAQSPATEIVRYGWKTTTDVRHDISVYAPWPGSDPTNNPGWKPTLQSAAGGPLDLAFKITTGTNTPPPPQCVETNGTKYVQPPNLNGGFDVWDNGPWVLADDFLCTTSGPITDIHLWGSYLIDESDTNLTFWLAIYDDVPVSATNNFSHPGSLLWHEEFAPGQYVQTLWGNGIETFLDPGQPAVIGPDSQVWYYCFYPTNAFIQQGGPLAPRVYWLMVYAQSPVPNVRYGWKSTAEVRNDISVYGFWPGFDPTNNPGWKPTRLPTGAPLDLAFKLTTGTNPPPQGCVETNGTKYVQWPNLIGGLDVWDNGPFVLADDFLCTNTGPVSDIHIWGSWLNDIVGPPPNFWLGLYDDVPVSPTNNFSHPGRLLWEQWFGPAQYIQSFWATGQESFLDPGPPQILGPDSQVWYYCFYPTNAYVQHGTLTAPQTFWLLAYAQSPAGSQERYGWKTTTNIQHDVSVHGPWPGAPPPPGAPWQPTLQASTGGRLDLAFKITTRTNCEMSVACAADKTVECGSSWGFDPPTVGPNPCCTNPPTVTLSGVTTNGFAPCHEILTAIWKITDCVGNLTYCTQEVSVVDTTAPVITCATNKTVECGTPWTFDRPTATDACCGTNVTIQLVASNSVPIGTCQTNWFGIWQATDCCSNTATCTQLVSVVDTTGPVITCPTNRVVKTCDTNVQVFWFMSAVDKCSSSVTVTSAPPSGAYFLANTTNTVTVIAWDACSNFSSCSFTVAVTRPILGSLSISLTNTNTLVVVQWTDGILQHCTNVLGPYVDILGALPPTYTTPVTNDARFYRLRCLSP
jgi:HYR domain